MVIVVSIVVVVAIAVVIAAVVVLTRRFLRWAMTSSERPVTTRSGRDEPPTYGRLHTPADPAGPLGHLSPDADLSSDGTDSRDLYGA